MSIGPCNCDAPINLNSLNPGMDHKIWCDAYDDGKMICPRCGHHLKSVEHNYCAITNFNNSGIKAGIKMHQEAIDEIFNKEVN